MTIQVKISHGNAGHPAPVYVQELSGEGKPIGKPFTLKEGQSCEDYIHSNKMFLVSERPFEGALT